MAFDDFDPAGAEPLENEDDLLDLAREESRAQTAAGKAPKGGNELDVDLFGFPLMDGSTPVQSVASEVASPMGALEEDIERITDQVNELIDDDLFEDGDLDDLEPVQPAAAPKAPKATPAKKTSEPVPVSGDELDELLETTTSRRKPAPAARAETQVTEAAAPTAQAPVVAATSFQFGRGALLVGAVAACFAAALLAVVWSTGRGVQEALATRTQTPTTEGGGLQGRIAELEAQLQRQREELSAALASEQGTEADPGVTVVRVEPEWFIERRLIQEAMAEGRFREARKRLFALQAVMDELSEDVSAELAPTVAFLIPETYRLQAEAQAEGGDQ